MTSTAVTFTRQAVVRGRAADLATIRRYLPSNYSADVDGEHVWISGQDALGWTLDDYVIPRLLSGMIRAEEMLPIPGLSQARVLHVTDLGQAVLDAVGEATCQEGYGTTVPFWVGHYAIGYGDIDEEGNLS